MSSRSLAGALGESVSWDAASGRVIIGGQAFTPYANQNGTTYVGVRQVAEALGYRVGYSNGNITISQAHTGAYVAESGVAELLKGERVMSPQLTVSFDRLASILSATPDAPERMAGGSGIGSTDIDRLIRAIETRKGVEIGTLFNAESVEFTDKVDMDYFMRAYEKVIRRLDTANG